MSMGNYSQVQKYIDAGLWYSALVALRSKATKPKDYESLEITEKLKNSIELILKTESKEWIVYVLALELAKEFNWHSLISRLQSHMSVVQVGFAAEFTDPATPKGVKQEFEELCLKVLSAQENSDANVREISKESLQQLTENFVRNPWLNCWLIEQLLCIWHGSFAANDLSIQRTFLTAAKDIFDKEPLRIHPALLCILSRIDLTEPMEDELLTWLFSQPLELEEQKDLKLAIYSRKNPKFACKWHEYLDEKFACRLAPRSLEDVERIVDTIFERKGNVCTRIRGDQLARRTLKNKTHWFTDILDICFILFENNRKEELIGLAQHPLLSKIWLPLLFHFLQHHFESKTVLNTSHCEALEFLLEKCELENHRDENLRKFDRKLRNHSSIVKWFHAQQQETNHQELTFARLQNEGSLKVLKSITNFHEMEFDKVKYFLRDDVEDVNVIQAYDAMLKALKAIFLCESYDMNEIEVTSHLQSMESSLQSLYPLKLRLETLENIFSFLFLRYEHFERNENNSEDSGEQLTDEEVAIKDRKREKLTSESSDAKQLPIGFICHAQAIKSILNSLKNSVLSTGKDFGKSSKSFDHEEEQKIVEKSLAAITKALADATWRFDLLSTHPEKKTDADRVEVVNARDSPLHHENCCSPEVSGSETFSLEVPGAKKRRKKQRASERCISNAIKSELADREWINFMLSPKESLVVQCLSRGNYDKAQQVIEMFNMRNTKLDGEVRFSKSLKAFKSEVQKYIEQQDSVDSRAKSPTSTIENIRQIVQEGFQSSRLTSLLTTFLASQEINVRLLNQDPNYCKDILTTAVLDLALTQGRTSQGSNHLVEVATNYINSRDPSQSTSLNFFNQLSRLNSESKLDMPLSRILCDARIPLSLKVWREKEEFWKLLMGKIEDFRTLQQFESEKIVGENNLQELAAICDNGETYLNQIFNYLKILQSILPEEDFADPMTLTSLLEKPLNSYFGRRIFQFNTEPEVLEPIAKKLKVNLTYSIIRNCCPTLPCVNHDTADVTSERQYIILNDNGDLMKQNDVSEIDPTTCISEILNEILEALGSFSTQSVVKRRDVVNSPAIYDSLKKILSKAQRLVNIDLGKLSMGEETLCFFINTWNVLLLHAIMFVWHEDMPESNLRHSMSLMSVGYCIGELGFVTLASLRAKLTGSSFCDESYFELSEELNEAAWQDLDLTQDPRVIFAIANEFRGTPKISVYKVDNLNSELEEAVKSYFESLAARESHSCELLWLPKPVDYYNDVHSRYLDAPLANDNAQKLIFAYEIKLQYTMDKWSEEVPMNGLVEDESWKTNVVRGSLLQHLDSHCWLLSYLVQRVHSENCMESSYSELKCTRCFENLLNSPWNEQLKKLCDNRAIVSCLQESTMCNELWSYLEKCLKQRDFKECLEIINALPDVHCGGIMEVNFLKDKLLNSLISQDCGSFTDAEILQTVYQIRDVRMLAQTVLQNLNKWPVNVCKETLFHALSHELVDQLPRHCTQKMTETLCRVKIFYKILPFCRNDRNFSDTTWYDIVHCTEKTDPLRIVKSLIKANKFELCLEWLESQAFAKQVQSFITQEQSSELLIGLLKNEERDYQEASKLLKSIPLAQSMKICSNILPKLDSIKSMRFIANYLTDNSNNDEEVSRRKHLTVGIEILSELEAKERKLYVHLVEEPSLILEQLMMNCRFEALQKILATNFREKLQFGDISVGSVDKIVRFYASKALDFRVALQREILDAKAKELGSSKSSNEDDKFVMPINIPTKEEWVPNDKARECSCCKVVIFSMFNRRHHCRRCGRVVCAVCSQQRIRVLGYSNSVPVRVCNDCRHQMNLKLEESLGTTSTPNSEVFDGWKLSMNQAHNQNVREEFSFEYAPNISLCLTILNLHSDHMSYASFLLDHCDDMKRLLQPVHGGGVNPEVDHSLLIKMIRSLLIAAKVKCAKLGLNAGLAHCDRFLSQVDLITTLVDSNCLDIIPPDNLDEHALRRLRDLLTEKEEWTLALNVSTKAGLETQGVWAAWGKACLKAGYFLKARQKFAHCLDKVLADDSDDWVFLSSGESPTTTDRSDINDSQSIRTTPSKKQETTKARPVKDPPLLLEILQLLQNSGLSDVDSSSGMQNSANVAQEIMKTLNGLKAVSQGQYGVTRLDLKPKSICYEESFYYLLMYGSNSSILDFLVKHNDFGECLNFALDNNIEPSVFFNVVYLSCLKSGKIDRLHEEIKSKDSSLLNWRKYLVFTCRTLEKRQFLNTLYQLQLFMSDYVRASMTCIRFYTKDCNSYTEMSSRVQQLYEAQKHLEVELQLESAKNKQRKKSVTSVQSGGSSLTMEMTPSEIDRHINTISRQIEVTKFLKNAEEEGRSVRDYLNRLSDVIGDSSLIKDRQIPTLFGDQREKQLLAVLAIVCGRDVEEGFGLAFRIMQDFSIRSEKVYALAGHVLALEKKTTSIDQLVKCCRSSGAPGSQAVSDRVLVHCVKLLLPQSSMDSNYPMKEQIDVLIRSIADIDLKISAYIESRQLKAAYLLAVKHSREQEICKILKEAERLGQTAIKAICIKWLEQCRKGSK